MFVPNCPACGMRMKEFVPLVYAGPGVHTFKCEFDECNFHVTIAMKDKTYEDQHVNRG